MNITREVITDLWPVYAAGEDSTDTRVLVEEYLQQDPEFAGLIQENGMESLLKLAPLHYRLTARCGRSTGRNSSCTVGIGR